MKFKLGIVLSFIALLGLAFISLTFGSFPLSVSEILKLIFGGVVSEQAYLVFFSFRLPRLILAALIGGALSLSGAVLQTVSRNPIADVGLLGINSGAACGSVFYFFLVGTYFSEFSQMQFFSLLFFSFIGGTVAILLNVLLSFRGRQLHMTLFILNGIGINLGFSAITTYLSLKISPEDFDRVNRWLEGSIASASWETTQKVIPVVLICALLLILTGKKLAILRFSDVHLLNVGFPIAKWRLFFLVLAAVLVSTTVFVAGSVAFVSLLVPHFTQLYLKRNSSWFLPMVFVNGMTFVILVDLFAKNLFAPNEIPLNAIMGAIGVPYLIVLYVKNRRQRNVKPIN